MLWLVIRQQNMIDGWGEFKKFMPSLLHMLQAPLSRQSAAA
jgi:hypothetical protein